MNRPGAGGEGRRILLTGGAGFIGSHLLRHMLRYGEVESVTNLDLLTYAGDLRRIEDLQTDARMQTVVGDVCDHELVRALFREHTFDTVLHLAAETHVDRSIADPSVFVRTNVQGTLSLLEAAREAWSPLPGGGRLAARPARFLHVSTDEVFGDLGPTDPPFAEDSPYRPSSPYSASKAAADHLVRAWHRTYGLPVLIVHPTNTFGPGQHAEKLIPTVVYAMATGSPVPLYGDGANVRDWLFVEDLCVALRLVLRGAAPGRSYVVGARNPLPNRLLVERVATIMDRRLPHFAPHRGLVTPVPDRPGHDRRYEVDARRIEQELGWKPGTDFLRALEHTVRAILASPWSPPG